MFFFSKKNKQADNIVITAMPKSASQSFITNFEKVYSNSHKIVRGKHFTGYGHNFLSVEKIKQQANRDKCMAIFGHIPLHIHNEKILTSFCHSKKVIVLIRSLPDVLLSHYEHIEKKGFGPLDYHVFKNPNVPESNFLWSRLSKTERIDFLIKFVNAWYINFVNGWLHADKIGWNIEFSCFENHTSDIQSSLISLNKKLSFASHDFSNKQKGDSEKVNYNIGKSGRGIKAFSKAQEDEIKRMLDLIIENEQLKKYLLSGGQL